MKILLLSRYDRLAASSRHRSYQYLPYLRGLGHDIDVAPLLSNRYLERLYANKHIPTLDVTLSYFRRMKQLMSSRSYDLLWLEYEAFPWIPYWFESLFLKSDVPYIVDYDDAIFHRYDDHSLKVVRGLLGKKIDHVMRNATLVIAGNDYIARRAHEAGAERVEILPTAVELDRYPIKPSAENELFTIGWIGTPKTAHYLKEAGEMLRVACRTGGTRVVAIGPSAIEIDGVPIELKSWNEHSEVEEMSRFDVGIMPLADSPWERGKSGYKLIQYMACSLPVVASPVGVNRTIVDHGMNGFLASRPDEWVTALNVLRDNRALRESMGHEGRLKVEKEYSTRTTAPRLAGWLNEVSKEDR